MTSSGSLYFPVCGQMKAAWHGKKIKRKEKIMAMPPKPLREKLNSHMLHKTRHDSPRSAVAAVQRFQPGR